MREADLPSLALIVPVYNEETRLTAILTLLEAGIGELVGEAGFRHTESIFVDDGSSDRTPQILAAAETSTDRLRVLRPTAGNRGKGAAIRAGLDSARAEYSLLLDVDLSTPIADLASLSTALRSADAQIAIGCRNSHASSVVAPLHRRALGSCFNLGVRLLTGLDHPDTQSGFKLLHTETGRELLETQLCPGFAFDVELLLRAQAHGVRVAEGPVSYVHDHDSRVHLVRTSAAMALSLVRLSLRLGRHGRRVRPKPRPGA